MGIIPLFVFMLLRPGQVFSQDTFTWEDSPCKGHYKTDLGDRGNTYTGYYHWGEPDASGNIPVSSGGATWLNPGCQSARTKTVFWNGTSWQQKHEISSRNWGEACSQLPGEYISATDYDNISTYLGECEPVCEDEIAEGIAFCGGIENFQFVSEENCEWYCKDCEDEYDRLQEECPHGYILDNDTCVGRCKDCDDEYDDIEAACADHGGILYAECSYDPQGGFTVDYTCKDGHQPQPLVPGDPADDPPAETDPADDPTTPDPDKTDPYSPAIKENTDKLIEQNNQQNAMLNTVNQNLENIANNQVAQNQNQQDDLSWLGNIMKGVERAIEKMADALEDLKPEPETTDIAPPDQPEWDSDLPDDYDYEEFDDYEGLAGQTSSETQSNINDIINANPNPVTSSITANGNACIDGTITLNGNNKNIQICFDRPWMLQGYAIMRLILIGIGYIQVAMMLNRGMLA
jgi:hypothetical protein